MTYKPTKTIACSVLSLIALLLLSGSYVHAADTTEQQPATDNGNKIYKKIGPDGEIIYSDKPVPGAEEVDVPPPSAYKPVPPPTTFTPYQAPPKTPTTKSITNTLTITEPKNEQTIWSGSGEFTMSVNLGSALLPGQQLEYLIDGNVVYSGTEASHTFTDIYRGAHVLTVRLSDNSGSSVTSPPVTFYMQRPRKKN